MRSLFVSLLPLMLAAQSGCAGPGVPSASESHTAGACESAVAADLHACPGDPAAAFLATRAEGVGLYERHSALQRVRARLNLLKARAERIERLLAEQAALLLAPDLAAEERRMLALDLRQLTEDEAEVALRLRALEKQQSEAERDYEDYRRHIAARSGG